MKIHMLEHPELRLKMKAIRSEDNVKQRIVYFVYKMQVIQYVTDIPILYCSGSIQLKCNF